VKVLLDTSVLGVLCHKDQERRALAETLLAAIQRDASEQIELIVPELADDELRRKLLHPSTSLKDASGSMKRVSSSLKYASGSLKRPSTSLKYASGSLKRPSTSLKYASGRFPGGARSNERPRPGPRLLQGARQAHIVSSPCREWELVPPKLHFLEEEGTSGSV
jgi:predicted nucleic acid-binding protein